MRSVSAAVPMKRLGTPDEIGQAVAWLCSEAASYVTGGVITVDERHDLDVRRSSDEESSS